MKKQAKRVYKRRQPAAYAKAQKEGPEAIREFFRQQGSKGGSIGGAIVSKTRSPEEKSRIAKKAVAARSSRPKQFTAEEHKERVSAEKLLAKQAALLKRMGTVKPKRDATPEDSSITYQQAIDGGPGSLAAFFQAKGSKGGKKGGANSRKNMTHEQAREISLNAALSKDGAKPPVITAQDVPVIRRRLALMAAAREKLRGFEDYRDGVYPIKHQRKVEQLLVIATQHGADQASIDNIRDGLHLQQIITSNAPLALSREYGCPVQSIKNIQFGLSFAWVR